MEKRYSLIIGRLTSDVFERTNNFLDEVSTIDNVIVDRSALSVTFHIQQESLIINIANKHGIVNFTKKEYL